MDYVDLYQIHRFDRNTPIEETLDALSDEELRALAEPYEPHPVLGHS